MPIRPMLHLFLACMLAKSWLLACRSARGAHDEALHVMSRQCNYASAELG